MYLKKIKFIKNLNIAQGINRTEVHREMKRLNIKTEKKVKRNMILI